MKAILVAAWFGTRTLPASKTVPKEMFPVWDRPVIQHIIEAMVAGGIKDIIMVTSQQKKVLEDYFDSNYQLEDVLKKKWKNDLLELINAPKKMANFSFVRQQDILWTGHAVLQWAPFISEDYFMSVLADTIYPPETFIEVIKLHQQTGGPVIAVHEVSREEVYKYGIVRLDGDRVVEFVEKPKVEDAPSNIISNGVMILPKEAFDIRRNAQVDHLWEVYIPMAVTALIEKYTFTACRLRPYLDTGSFQWLIEANARLYNDGYLFPSL